MFIEYNGSKIEMNDKYSCKDFTMALFLDANDLKDINIFGSCFSKEIPDTKVFPDDMIGVIFYCCNLDNVIVPPGNNIFGCRHNRFRIQNDFQDWIIGADDKPIEPINKKGMLLEGKNIDPAKIPAKAIKEERVTRQEYEGNIFGAWFKSKPEIVGSEKLRVTKQILKVDLPKYDYYSASLKDVSANPKYKKVPDTMMIINYEEEYLTVKGEVWLIKGKF